MIKACCENILIFTDGSKNQYGHTGYVITFSEEKLNEIAEPLPTYSSIFRAKVIAICLIEKHVNYFMIKSYPISKSNFTQTHKQSMNRNKKELQK